MNPLLAAHRHTWDNPPELEAGTMCGCCACMEVFPADEIVAWTGLDMNNLNNPDTASGETALCLRCGGEALIGDKAGSGLTPDFLSRTNQAWFQKALIRKPSPKRP